MPEGHSVHRIARQFDRHFVGERVAASSPQGRFVDGAALIDGRTMTDSKAVGKQLFLEFDEALYLRVHLGIYGAWDFSGEVSTKLGQTGEYSRPDAVVDLLGEDSVRSKRGAAPGDTISACQLPPTPEIPTACSAGWARLPRWART